MWDVIFLLGYKVDVQFWVEESKEKEIVVSDKFVLSLIGSDGVQVDGYFFEWEIWKYFLTVIRKFDVRD